MLEDPRLEQGKGSQAGESFLPERMISCCDNGAQRLACIRSWKSTSVHVSDFVFEAGAGVAIDAKTLTSNRRHIITSVDQVAQGMHLETGPFSIMIRQVNADGEDGYRAPHRQDR